MREKIIFLSILFVAFLLRFIFLGTNPPAMHADEADTGYTAFSLIKTLHDPYGNFLPLQFQAQSNVYRAPLYTYLTVPFVYVFGLSPLSTRMASALLGVIFVGLVYLVTLKFFEKKEVAMYVGILAAINPWSILLSRTGLEVNLCVVIVTAAITFFLYRNEHNSFVPISAFLFGLSLFSYHPAKIAVPIILIFLLFLYHKEFLKKKLMTLLSAGIFSAFFMIVILLALYNNGAKEFSNASIFDAGRAHEIVNTQRTQSYASLKVSPFFSNKAIYYGREFFNHYLAPISINYLFLNGEANLDKGFGNYGQYHLFELPLVLFGIILAYRKYRKIFYLLIGVFLIGLIPGGITKNGYYSYRDVILMPIPLILGGLGVWYFRSIYTKKLFYILAALIVATLYSLSYFLYNLFYAYPVYSRDWWGVTQREALEFVHDKKNTYQNIYIQGGTDWNILYAFYYQFDPSEFQNSYKKPLSSGNKIIFKVNGVYMGNFLERDSKEFIAPVTKGKAILIAPGSYFPKKTPLKSFFSVDGVNVDIKAFEFK